VLVALLSSVTLFAATGAPARAQFAPGSLQVWPYTATVTASSSSRMVPGRTYNLLHLPNNITMEDIGPAVGQAVLHVNSETSAYRCLNGVTAYVFSFAGELFVHNGLAGPQCTYGTWEIAPPSLLYPAEAPLISATSPLTPHIGASLSVSGRGFGTRTSASSVHLVGYSATASGPVYDLPVYGWAPDSVLARVPATVRPGRYDLLLVAGDGAATTSLLTIYPPGPGPAPRGGPQTALASFAAYPADAGAANPTWRFAVCCTGASAANGGTFKLALILPEKINGATAFGVPVALPPARALVNGHAPAGVQVLAVSGVAPGAPLRAGGGVLEVPGLYVPGGTGDLRAIVLTPQAQGGGKALIVTLGGPTGLRNPPRPGTYPIVVALLGQGRPRLTEVDALFVERPATRPLASAERFPFRSLHQAMPSASGAFFSAATTFSGQKGIYRAANVFDQAFSVPHTPCSLSLSEFLSPGNESWDWPMQVQGQLSRQPTVGQAGTGALALFPQVPSSGTSFQISAGVGVSTTVSCPWTNFTAGNILGFANATTAAAPMPGETLSVPNQGCPGWSYGVPYTNLGIGVAVCPVVELSGTGVSAGLTATDAQVSPASASLGPGPSSFTATPEATSWGLGLSGLGYQPALSVGIDLTVSYNLGVCLPFNQCWSGTLYTSPTLYFEQGVPQDAGGGSPSSLSFSLSASKGTSSTSFSTTSPLAVGSQATLSASVSPSVSDGTVSFSADGAQVGSCTPSNGKCTTTWTPSQAGDVKLTASWGGDSNYLPSSASTWATVYPAGPQLSVWAVPSFIGWVYSCAHTPWGTYCSWVYEGNTSSVVATLYKAGSPVAGATVSFSASGGSLGPSSCTTGSGGQCTITFAAPTEKSGSYTITAKAEGATASTQVSYNASR
jgi:hypothetical protein